MVLFTVSSRNVELLMMIGDVDHEGYTNNALQRSLRPWWQRKLSVDDAVPLTGSSHVL